MFRALARSIGVDGALELTAKLGGLEFYIPHGATESHPVYKLLGPERFACLIRTHGGQRIAIPLNHQDRCSKGQILTLLEEGHDARYVARACGVTQRYVRRVAELLNETTGGTSKACVDSRQIALPFVIK
jgi:hypothetical protein